MRCTTCGEFVYKGKKFNARKQPTGESYLGIKIIRFYIKCPRCSGEIRFKTEPKIGDYVCEVGAVRNYEPWRERVEEEETIEERLDRLEKEDEEKQEKDERERLYGPMANTNGNNNNSEDPIGDLESKVLDAKREMEIQDELDELRSRNARIDIATNHHGLLEKVQQGIGSGVSESRQQQDAEDEQVAKKAFRRTSDGERLKTVELPSSPKVAPIKNPVPSSLSTGKRKVNSLGVIVKKKRSLI